MPSMKALRREVACGTLGAIMHVEGNYSHDWLKDLPVDSWRAAPEESRAGGMTGMGIHVLDCFRDVVGPMRRISALSKRRALALPTGDTTAALLEFESGATGTLATTLKTPFEWRLAVYGENAWAASVSETRLVTCRAGGEPLVTDFPPANYLGENVELFAAAALGRETFPIDAAGILQTISALDAVFRSVDVDGAWQRV
jgi:predicted dehydrogenase